MENFPIAMFGFHFLHPDAPISLHGETQTPSIMHVFLSSSFLVLVSLQCACLRFKGSALIVLPPLNPHV